MLHTTNPVIKHKAGFLNLAEVTCSPLISTPRC